MADPFDSLTALARGLAERRFSAVELTELYLTRIERLDTALNSYVSVTAGEARAQAAAADARLARGEATALTGIPIAHKDLFCTRGVPTTCGSRMLEGFVPPYDACVVERLDAAGAVMLGKTNLDEFAMGSSTETSHFGATANPWDTERVPGGSSGGSAAAVAAGLCAGATGTDTGGSIRQPAAFCGVTGLKPTYGRVSRFGMVAFASSLDQAGPIARSAEDCALLFAQMQGFDARDSTSIAEPPAIETTSPMTIGLPREYFEGAVDAQHVEAARAVLESLGHRVVDVSLPHTRVAIGAYYVIAGAEASTNLSRFDGVRFGHRCEAPRDLTDLYARSRSEGFGLEVKRRILTGTYALSVGYYDAYYRQAQRVRRLIARDFAAAFAEADVLLAPTAPGTAFRRGAMGDDPVAMYLQDVFTVPASLAGIPALSLPAGFTGSLPVGVQLMAPHFADERVLALGRDFQAATDWHTRHPEAP